MVRRSDYVKYLQLPKKKSRFFFNFLVFIPILFAAAVTVFLMNQKILPLNELTQIPEIGSDSVSVEVISVGNADAILLSFGDAYALIDTGASDDFSTNALKQSLLNRQVKTLKYLFITHSHNDHTGGLQSLLKYCDVENVILPNSSLLIGVDPDKIAAVYAPLSSSSAKRVIARAGASFELGKAIITVLYAGIESKNENNLSLALRFEYNDFSFITAGDLESGGEKALIESGANLNCEVLKVSHHGAADASSDEFLAKVSPRIAIISCGKDNEYGHPNPKTLERIRVYTKKIYRTDVNGSVFVLFKNGELNVSTSLENK